MAEPVCVMLRVLPSTAHEPTVVVGSPQHGVMMLAGRPCATSRYTSGQLGCSAYTTTPAQFMMQGSAPAQSSSRKT